jgi:hypothetical protein
MSRVNRLLCRAAVVTVALSFGCAEKPSPPGGEEGATPGAASSGPGQESAKGEEKAGPEGSPASPGDAFLAAQRAMKARDFGALFDVLSSEAQERFRAGLEADAASSAGVPFVKDTLGLDPQAAAMLPPREAFITVMTAGAGLSEKLAASVGVEVPAVPEVAEAEVADVTGEGEMRTVTFELPGGAKGTIELVLEGGGWKLDELPWLVKAARED